MWYYNYRKRKEITQMKNNIYFVNCDTAELTDNHDYAMEWYRAGVEVALMSYSATLGEWVERGRWIH